ncbi:hypothetical protein RUND412_009549 [Rhizina undulata]
MEVVQEFPFPASTKQAARIINGIPTDAMVVSLADKIVITITQQGRLAQWVHVPLDARHLGLLETKSATDDDGLLPLTYLTPVTLLGGTIAERESLGQLVTVQLASAIAMRNNDESRMVLVGLGLKSLEMDRDSFIQLIELVGNCL